MHRVEDPEARKQHLLKPSFLNRKFNVVEVLVHVRFTSTCKHPRGYWKVKNAARQAQIHDFIVNTPNQYNEKVGERGIKLSGGQRQRIGIARALYREAKVILFDEATNQLDTNTESLIVQSINNLDKEITIILIAHRLSTLEDCDQIIDLSKI